MPEGPDTAPWHLLVPVKRLSAAKSRLRELTPSLRAQLAFAMALDTIEAAREAFQVGDITVLTDEPACRALLRSWASTYLPTTVRGT